MAKEYSNMRIVPRDALVLDTMINDCVNDSQKWFPGEAQGLGNLVLCVAGEVGEVANIVKKHVRGSLREEDMLETLPEEIVDILIYLCNLMGHSVFQDVDWAAVWNQKRQYNEMRFGPRRTDTRDLAEGIADVPEEAK